MKKPPFGRLQISGPLGITLLGPEEHTVTGGLESRFSWRLPPRKSNHVTEGDSLVIRIEKRPGIRPEYDHHSTIVRLTFTETEQYGNCLQIRLEDTHTIPRHTSLAAVGLFNQYLNRVMDACPDVLIPVEVLTDEKYEVSYETGYRGDFLILTSQTQRVSINLWAAAMLDGLSVVAIGKERNACCYSASFFLGLHCLGSADFKAFRTGGFKLHPFFEVVHGARLLKEDPPDYGFQHESYFKLLGILANHGGDPSQPMLFEEFSDCSYRYENDHQEDHAEKQRECLADFKRLLRKLLAS